MNAREAQELDLQEARIQRAKQRYAELLQVIAVASEGGGITETAARLQCSREKAWTLRTFLGLQRGNQYTKRRSA